MKVELKFGWTFWAIFALMFYAYCCASSSATFNPWALGIFGAIVSADMMANYIKTKVIGRK